MENEINLAGIEYLGDSGSSLKCQGAVIMILQSFFVIPKVYILTYETEHGLLLMMHDDSFIGIKSGFSSGYGGTGPSAFSYTLLMLHEFKSDIFETNVTMDVLNRLNSSSLTKNDISSVINVPKMGKWTDYILSKHIEIREKHHFWSNLHNVWPLSIIDIRLKDVVVSFWENPEEKLLTGYKRIEDIVRRRIKSDESGAKLFSIAFSGDKPKLIWNGINKAEQQGRANIFTGIYMAHRNPRAHKEIHDSDSDCFRELLLLNNLYILERTAVLNYETAYEAL